jgi:hypothetical protein
MHDFEVEDRVRYSGPVVNESWPDDRLGTVTGVTFSTIDIRWDGGGSNYGHDPRHFSHAS